MYKIVYENQAEKFLRKTATKDLQKIKIKIEQVAQNPFSPHPSLTPLKDIPHGYRLRIGRLRVIYQLTPSKTLIVWKISPRSSVYKP